MTTVIRAVDVRKHWGSTHALAGVTVDVGPGITGLLGANGAGKTTLIGLVLGLHRPDGGELEVLGKDPTRFGPQIRARIGYGPEHDALPGEAQAQDFVRHFAEMHGLPRKAAVARASETLTLVGLGEERLREIGTLSLGQKQRVKIAQAIAHDPDLVLLDEPTNGLDPLQREDMLQTIARIGRELGIHVVVSSHLIHEVERICDHVVVLDEGRVRATGDMVGLLSGGGALSVEVDGDVDTVLAELARRNVTAAAGDRPGQLLVEAEDEAVLDTIRDSLADLELPLRSLQPASITLQDRFFGADT